MSTRLAFEDDDRRILLNLARESIRSHIEGRPPLYDEPTEALREVCGAFVSLHIDGRLRGCIGTLRAADQLAETIKEMAKSSAFHDPRFPPLSNEELADVEIEISVLTPLQKMTSVDEVEIGKHGLYATKGSFSGVLLPQVPLEQGWDRDTFLSHTCRKAGLPEGAWRSGDVDLYTFSAVVFSEDG